MNKKYTYRWTANEDYSKTDDKFTEETDYIITDGVYDFEDWLNDNVPDYRIERDGNTYYLVDVNGDRTGEAYWVIREENTDEELVG